ncbi:MAG: hypothetical protein ACI8UO_004759 [Verrucomicrobiales bacterium]|jgi:hypothetical protein
MTNPEAAAENLRVIRKLMERATLYRAISAPTALVGGVLAIATAFALSSGLIAPGGISPLGYYGVWVLVLFAIDVFNTFLLWRDARRRGSPLFTPGMTHALKSLIPPLLAGGVISFFLVHESIFIATLCWVVFYGLALLATHGFSPASMKALGSVFVLAGLGIWAASWQNLIQIPPAPDQQLLASCLVMGLTFGLFHIVYAVSIGLTTRFRISKRPGAEADADADAGGA